MTASSSAVDPGLAIVEQLRSLSETPGLDMFLLQARNDEDVCNYLFSEEAHRIQLLKILFKKIDDTLEYSKKETEILEILQNLCIGCGFCNSKDSRSFVIGKMSVENQCRIWEKIMDGVKSIMECDDVFDEVDNDVIKVQSFFKNPLLNDFLSLIPKVTDRNLPLNHCDSENLDCEIENARLKLENYMEMEIPNPDQEPTSLESDSPSILPVDQLLDTIKKWEIGFQDHLEGNLSVTSPEKAAIDLANKESNKKISQSIRSLRACCSTIEKNIENRKLLTELEGRVRDTNKIEDEGSLS